MALNVGLGVSFGSMYDWKGTREEAGEVNGKKTYLTRDKF
jgi:hypothetical protein